MMTPRRLRAALIAAVALAFLTTASPPTFADEPDDDPCPGQRVAIRTIGKWPSVHVFETGASRGYLGVWITSSLTDELRRHFGAPADAGVLVSRVSEDSPAARAGVRVGDVITAIDGQAVTSLWDLRRGLEGKDKGQRVDLTLVRDGRELTFAVEVESRVGRTVELDRFDHPLTPEQREALREKMRERMESVEWDEIQGQVDEAMARAAEAMSRVDLPVLALPPDRGELEARLRELEGRLKELEARLGEKR